MELKVIKHSITSIIWLAAVAIYLGVSFLSGRWEITWIIFPITVAINAIINIIVEVKQIK